MLTLWDSRVSTWESRADNLWRRVWFSSLRFWDSVEYWSCTDSQLVFRADSWVSYWIFILASEVKATLASFSSKFSVLRLDNDVWRIWLLSSRILNVLTVPSSNKLLSFSISAEYFSHWSLCRSI